MPLILPTSPAPRQMSWRYVSATNSLVPAFGGADQELLRKGTRYALTFTFPPMSYVQNMEWDDVMEEGQTVVMNVYQPGFSPGIPGSPLVNGSGQAGKTLSIKGLTPGYTFTKGQWLSIITGGQRFLYRVAAQVGAPSGTASVPLRTLLRKSPSNNDVVEVFQPKVEGFVRDLEELTVGVERLVSMRFTVRERE